MDDSTDVTLDCELKHCTIDSPNIETRSRVLGSPTVSRKRLEFNTSPRVEPYNLSYSPRQLKKQTLIRTKSFYTVDSYETTPPPLSQNGRHNSISATSPEVQNNNKYGDLKRKKPTVSRRNYFTNSFSDFPETEHNWKIAQLAPLVELPSVPGEHPDLNSISPETVIQLLNGNFKDYVDDVIIVDCRFPFEYEGGHIKGAINISNPSLVQERFINIPKVVSRKVIIFYCEFSSKRGPTTLRYLRELDRKANLVSYPRLDYPNLYLLDGGYKKIYEYSSLYCEPQQYVTMRDKKFKEEKQKGMTALKSWNKNKSQSSLNNEEFDEC